MSLQGSLETFALPDVLVLLASTKKDGELRVVGGKVDGQIWVEKGQIVHSDVNSREASSVDALFELLRLENGTFSFEGDSAPPARHEPETIDVVLADAQVRLGEWKEIAKVVPHLDVLVDMAEKAPSPEVVISATQWGLLRAVAGGSTVAGLMAARDLNEFDACKSVKELFEANLISMDLTAKPKAKPEPAPEPVVEAKAAPVEAPNVHKRPADMPPPAAPAAKADDKGEKSASGADAKRVEEVKAEVEKELAALVDEAAKDLAPKTKVRATTNAPGGPQPPEPTAGARAAVNGKAHEAKAPEVKPEETKALVAQLAALEGENEEKIAKKVEEHLARGGELPEVTDGDEPINRGLLLKFLSSVRN